MFYTIYAAQEMKPKYAEFVLHYKIQSEMCSTKCAHKILGTKLTVHKIFSTKCAAENMLHKMISTQFKQNMLKRCTNTKQN